jgi:hypothetical protein
MPPLIGNAVGSFDGSPDNRYVFRVLAAYRANGLCRWQVKAPDALLEALNRTSELRVEVIDRAVGLLEAALPPHQAAGVPEAVAKMRTFTGWFKEPILPIQAYPDEKYPLRILQAHRSVCEPQGIRPAVMVLDASVGAALEGLVRWRAQELAWAIAVLTAGTATHAAPSTCACS